MTVRAAEPRGGTTVFYLARRAEGEAPLDAFAESYRRHPAGTAHELVLICKGAERPSEVAAVSARFAGIPHRAVPASDAGYDIHAYLGAAATATAGRLCFLNTFSEIRAEDWLAKLSRALDRPGAGLVGASASYESLRDTRALTERLRWLVLMRGATLPPAEAERAYWLMRSHLAGRRERPTDWRDRLAGTLLGRTPCSPAVLAEFAAMRRALAPLNRASELDDIPRFPNAHLRSNAMMIETALLLEFGFDVAPTKAACFRFESGADSLTRRVRAKGLDALLVGADGEAYAVEDWPQSRTFRLGGQDNLLVADNQTRRFDALPAPLKEVYARLTWGDAPGQAPLFATPLRRDALRQAGAPAGDVQPEGHAGRHARGPAAGPTGEPPLFSIVLPTCDAAAVQDTIETVLRQDHPGWELVLFDNATSAPDAAPALARLDPRIRVSRSGRRLGMAESWRVALGRAAGRYVVVLGDDDGLAPGALARLAETIAASGEPDLVLGRVVSVTAPGAIEGEPRGVATELVGDILLASGAAPSLVPASTLRRAVSGVLGFRRVSEGRLAGMAIRGDVLRRLGSGGEPPAGPLPELFLTTMALGLAERVVADPAPLSIVGMRAGSYTAALIDRDEAACIARLGISGATTDLPPAFTASAAMPGSRHLAAMLLTLAEVARRLGPAAPRAVALSRFRLMQCLSFVAFQERRLRWPLAEGGASLWDALSWPERAFATCASYLHVAGMSGRFAGWAYGRLLRTLSPEAGRLRRVAAPVGPGTLLEVYDALAASRLQAARGGVRASCETRAARATRPDGRSDRRSTA